MSVEDALASYCGKSSLEVWEKGYLAPCFQDAVLWNILYIYFFLVGTYWIISLIRRPSILYPYYWAFYVKSVCHFILVIMPCMVLFGLYFRGDLDLFQTVYYIETALIWIYSLLVMNVEYSRGRVSNWVLKSFWTGSFVLSAVRMQTLVVRARYDLVPVWEPIAFAVGMLAVTVLCCLVLFHNVIPNIPVDDYRKLSEEERQQIVRDLLRQKRIPVSTNGTTYGKTAKPLEDFREPSPELTANIFSQLTYSWLDPLLKTGNQRVLEDQDLYKLIPTDTALYNSTLFNKYWREQETKHEHKPSVLHALVHSFGWKFAFAGLLKLANDALTFVGPLCLNRIVSYLEDEAGTPLWVPFMYVGIMTLGSIALSFCQQSYFYIVFRISMKVRAAVVTAIYDKAFKLNNQARQASTTGEIVNHMSIDSQRLMDLIPYLHQLWSGPLQILVCLGFLAFFLGWSLLAGIALMIILIPVNGVIIKKLKTLQVNIMKKKDERVRLTNEVLQGIRVIKFFAWEDSFKESITAIRNVELHNLKSAAYWGSIVMFMWMSTPLFVSIVTFSVFTLTGHTLTAEIAFTSLALFNILRFPLNMLPTVITSMVDANISLKRISKYLISDELDPHAIEKKGTDSEFGARIINGTFGWSAPPPEKGDSSTSGDTDKKPSSSSSSSSTSAPSRDHDKDELKSTTTTTTRSGTSDDTGKRITLHNINFTVPRGQLVAVCGQVGSGKSSLLAALLGDIDKLNGRVEVNGSVAYAAQEAWIQNATILDNILFGRPYEHDRYRRAIRVCELESDLKVLPDGDQTEIGEKGINLSGGQKQRVSMARAVYANADIYLLDDPLSAVDAHVGKNIFGNCICKELKGKTRVLVTHQLQHLPKADLIVVLTNGTISEVGSHEQLMAAQGEYANLFHTHVNQGEREDEEESEAAEEAKEQEKKAAAKLITQEERESGDVSSAVYKMYAVSLGGAFVVVLLFFLFLFEQLSKVAADWWLSYWSDTEGDGRTDKFYIGIYALIGLINSVMVLSRALVFAKATINSAKKIHEELLANVMRIPMSFFDTTPAGRILNRFSKDQYNVDQSLPRTLSMFVVIMFASLSILVVIGAVTPFFLTAVIPLAYIYMLIQKYYIRSSREIKRLDGVSRSPIFSHFQETLTGVSTVKAFAREQDFIDENQERLDINQRAFFIGNAANRWLALRLEMLGTAVVGLASLFCVIERDNIDPGAAGLSLTYALQTTSLLNWLVRMYTETESQMVSVERLVEYSHVPQEAPAITNYRPPKEWPSEGKIEFKNLQLRYRDKLELVLKGITCTIKPREKIGVVGRTGAGKSTLMLALFRLVEAAGGSILIDGIDISKIGLRDLRKKISIIPQDPTLFTGTFRSNLDTFNDFEDEAIISVLRATHLYHLVEENGGLNGKVSEGGGNISVGQRQLMCLARALLRRSRIIVMDEATASVDFETDSLIQKTINEEFKDCTVLIIAHRIHTIENCDRVLVLNYGQVAEFDEPNVLKQQDSLFASMVNDSGTSKN